MRSNEGGGCGSYGFISTPITDHEPDSADGAATVTNETRKFRRTQKARPTRDMANITAGTRRDPQGYSRSGSS